MARLITRHQKGYVESSMSVRAKTAYAFGEMPKSKWTKAQMLESMRSFCDEHDLYFAEPNLTRAELFEQFFQLSSWHHTSKFANATDFYALNETALKTTFRAMTAEEIQARDIARARAIEQDCEQRRLAINEFEERQNLEREYERTHGFAPDTVAAFMDSNPQQCEFFTSKRGTSCVRINDIVYSLDHAKRTRLQSFDALSDILNLQTTKAANETLTPASISKQRPQLPGSKIIEKQSHARAAEEAHCSSNAQLKTSSLKTTKEHSAKINL